jgi:secreted Zn-dependent insulinase-like peptidase
MNGFQIGLKTILKKYPQLVVIHLFISSSVMLSLFLLMCKHHLVEELYPATVAGLSYHLFSLEKGVVLSVSIITIFSLPIFQYPLLFKVDGYNEKLHLLVEKITNCMINLKTNMRESIFDIFKVQLAKNLFNLMIKPNNLNK